MMFPSSCRGLRRVRPRFQVLQGRLPTHQCQRSLFTVFGKRNSTRLRPRPRIPLAIITGGLFVWLLYPSEDFARLSSHPASRKEESANRQRQESQAREQVEEDDAASPSAWSDFSRGFRSFSNAVDLQWTALSDSLVDYILPEWSKLVPGYLRKLQHELSISPGSLADEIWSEAHDPLVNPEIRYSAEVRISSDLCKEEKEFLSRRKRVIRVALARYLGLQENDIHPDDIPTIAMCGSGGGLRALIAGTGSMLATEEDGLFDCITYTAGVSGSCWLQALYLSSFTRGRISALVDHLKARAPIHIAYPPVAFQSLVSLPTSKYLLSGMVEKLKGDANATFGLVDVYGLLLGARYLVPKGDLGVSASDFKLSSQREYIKYGQNPLPIYTAVRHEIPGLPAEAAGSLAARQKAAREAWFQWFEFTPYEFFCEEFNAGIPTWAVGRKFNNGKDVPPEHGFHLPEIRMPLLMGIFGSAFCATLNHYYREIKPLVKSMAGMGAVDDLISGKSEDLSKVHPIDPATIHNFAYGMQGKLPKSTPASIYENEYIQLMDAGMSNNLPIYPLLRPGRNVDVLVTFDASADVKIDNWLSVADGYARKRGIKGWPVGVGWPKPGEPVSQTVQDLEEASADTTQEANQRLQEAKAQQSHLREEAAGEVNGIKTPNDATKFDPGNEDAGDLGYCTVWVGSTEERKSTDPRSKSKAVSGDDKWQLMHPKAGIAVIYLPFLSNDKVPDVSPGTSDFLSTWNFVYTPEQIDGVVRLARANYDEGKEQIRSTIRAVYERKKKLREEGEKKRRDERYHSITRRRFLGDGDQFS
ncbi:unnamed protein product [Clonostachys rosea f. rosea IK726]|uniref:Lysophospholipase n=2 Tax=Bionectria ochroleuca TaxID=29856 RepID=A0A0B7JT10_BIOOC|nr:unnamed protein product [Clonostachys rosea f. rosea IK726]